MGSHLRLGGAFNGAIIVFPLLTLLLIFGSISIVSTSESAETSKAIEVNLSQPEVSSSLANKTDAGDVQHEQQASTSKVKNVNFTLVEQEFAAALSDEEVALKWRQMDHQFSDGIKAILKMIFPQIVAISQDAKVSGDCSGGILKWILSLRNLRSWAIKMLDASGKPTSGIFEGSLTMFGNYRQCLAIRAPDEDEIEISERFEEYFRGQFCVLHLRPWLPAKQPYYNLNSSIEFLQRKNFKYYEKTLYDELAEIAIAFQFMDIRMDLCVPSTCSLADIQRVADLLSRKLEMRAKVMRCDVESREPISAQLVAQFDQTSYAMLALPATMIFLALIASLVQIFIRRNRRRSNFASFLECVSLVSILKSNRRSGSKYLSQVPKTTSSVDTQQTEEVNREDQVEMEETTLDWAETKALPLYGLRNLFVGWFIIVQLAAELQYQFLRESLTLRHLIISYWPFQILVNSSLVFESLIVITAFTFGFSCFERSASQLIAYLIRKYLRLVIPIATVVILTIVTPILSFNSPVWRNFVEQQASICKSTGYIDLLFLQNFISYDKMCLPHSWLFCVELQLAMLFVPVLILLKSALGSDRGSSLSIAGDREAQTLASPIKRLLFSRSGLLSILILIGGASINFIVVYSNQLPPSWFHTFPDVQHKSQYFSLYQTKPWAHLSAFLIGLLGGCIAHLKQRNLSIKNKLVISSSSNAHLFNRIDRSQDDGQSSPTPSNSTIRTHFSAKQSQLGSSAAMVPVHLFASKSVPGTQANQLDQTSNGCKWSWQSVGDASLQLAGLAAMFALIFSTFEWSTQKAPSNLIAGVYDASSRIIWSLALVCLMNRFCRQDPKSGQLLCKFGAFFAGSNAITFGRMSFLAYLLAPYVHNFVLALAEQSLFPSLFLIFHLIVGNIVIIYGLAWLLAIFIEQPMSRLAKRLLN